MTFLGKHQEWSLFVRHQTREPGLFAIWWCRYAKHTSSKSNTPRQKWVSKFCELRPANLKLFEHLPHQVCICSYHENVRLLLLLHLWVLSFPHSLTRWPAMPIQRSVCTQPVLHSLTRLHHKTSQRPCSIISGSRQKTEWKRWPSLIPWRMFSASWRINWIPSYSTPISKENKLLVLTPWRMRVMGSLSCCKSISQRTQPLWHREKYKLPTGTTLRRQFLLHAWIDSDTW